MPAPALPDGLAAWCRFMLAGNLSSLPAGLPAALRYVVGLDAGSGQPLRDPDGSPVWEVGYAHAAMLVMDGIDRNRPAN